MEKKETRPLPNDFSRCANKDCEAKDCLRLIIGNAPYYSISDFSKSFDGKPQDNCKYYISEK